MRYKEIINMAKPDFNEAMKVLATTDLGGVDDNHILTAYFPDGKSMDIQGICHGKGESWVEAVLYEKDENGWWEVVNNGNTSDTYEGLWTVTDWNHDEPIIYEVQVIIV